LLWLVSSLLYLLCEAVSASAFPHYNYALNYISDLGMPESPLHEVMNFGFIARGLMFAIASVLIARGTQIRRSVIFLGLALCHGLGGILVGLVPAGPSSAAAGIAFIHVLGALLAIVSGNAILIYVGVRAEQFGASRSYRKACVAAGTLGCISFAMLIVNMGLHHAVLFDDGVWERLSVYPIVIWTAVTGLMLLARTRAG